LRLVTGASDETTAGQAEPPAHQPGAGEPATKPEVAGAVHQLHHLSWS
jgi:hypothetical protein